MMLRKKRAMIFRKTKRVVMMKSASILISQII
jgi:hypothetical protein